MNRALEIASMPFRAIAAAVTFTGGVLVAAGGAASMVFARTRTWAIRVARTRIDYRSEIGDPVSNSIVGAVVRWKARNFPEAPVRIKREGAPIDDPGILPAATGLGFMLRLLEKPNSYYSGVLQWNATIVDFCIGDAYWIKVRGPVTRTGQLGRVKELWWVPRRMMEPRWPQADPSVFIGWYDYTVDGRVYQIDRRDVVHFRNGIDPLNPRKGLGALGGLLREIYTDEEASAFTASLLRNLGVPGVVISPANTTSGRPVRVNAAATKKTFMDSFSGDSRGEPMVMSAATEVKVLSWSPEQMNLRELRRIPEERVTANLGVPAGVVGLGAGLDRNTFSNYGEANRAAYTQGVIPEQRLIAAELEVQLLPEFGDGEGLDVWFDWTQASAFLETAADIWKRNSDAATRGLQTRADWKRSVGKKPADDGSDDVYILPNGWMVIDGKNNTKVAGGGPTPAPTAPQVPGGPKTLELPEHVPDTAASSNGNGHHPELAAAGAAA